MAHYKHIDTSPRFLAVDLEAQLLPGSFEHALNHLIDHEIDLGAFDARFNNDEVGASAYPPAMLLKVVLLAYRRTKQMCPACGLTSTRRPLIYWDTFTRTVREANVSLRLCARQIRPCADPTAAAVHESKCGTAP